MNIAPANPTGQRRGSLLAATFWFHRRLRDDRSSRSFATDHAHVQLAAATPPAAGQLMLPFRPSYGLRDKNVNYFSVDTILMDCVGIGEYLAPRQQHW